jgi:tetratricopeptide (TPR) repeat protein
MPLMVCDTANSMNRSNLLLIFPCIGVILCIGTSCHAENSDWQLHMDAGREAFKQGDLAKADIAFGLAVKDAEVFSSPDLRLAISLISLADAYRQEGKKPQQHYLRALAIREKVLGPDSLDVAAVQLDLASLDSQYGENFLAEQLYKRALAIKEKSLGASHPDVVAVLEELGHCEYMSGLEMEGSGKSEEAEQHYMRALQICEKPDYSKPLDVAGVLDNLAELYSSEKKYPKASSQCERALAIREKMLGPNDPAVAKSLADLAMLYARQDKFADSELLVKRAAAIWKSVPEGHPRVATDVKSEVIDLNNLGVIFMNKGKYAEAEAIFDELIKLDPSYQLGYWNRSITRRNLGDIKGAEEDKSKECP